MDTFDILIISFFISCFAFWQSMKKDKYSYNASSWHAHRVDLHLFMVKRWAWGLIPAHLLALIVGILLEEVGIAAGAAMVLLPYFATWWKWEERFKESLH
jgi:hypothetical protein